MNKTDGLNEKVLPEEKPKNRRGKNKKNAEAKNQKIRYKPLPPRKKFALLPGFYIFCFVWILALIFTQALRSPLSAVLFIFVTIIPYFNLIYVFIARSALSVSIDNSCSETVKLSPVKFNVIVGNTSFLPVPFVEADIIIPNAESVRCMEQRVYLALSSGGMYEISEEVSFSYRGQYNIGVSNIYVQDFFRMFRLRHVEEQYSPIFVLPRRMILDHAAENAASDVNTESMKNVRGIDRAEMSDVRVYRQGDHMKTIHWKLSSKTQDLQVKEYAMNSGKTVYVFCDLAVHYSAASDDELYEDDINEYASDGVIEIAIAAAMREVKSSNACKLIWYDSRIPGGTQICYMESVEDLERGFKTFATAELCPRSSSMTKLVALITETQGVSVLFVTPLLDSELVDGLSEAASLINSVSSSGAIELYYYNPSERIRDAAERKRHKDVADSCAAQLISTGVRVAEIKL